jgi:bifunctional non-homologous end joining protein LigD
VTWDEVRACRHVTHLRFTADEVLERVEDIGDLFADLESTRVTLPSASEGSRSRSS